MDTRVEALVSLLEDLERLERHMLHLVDTNDACAIETTFLAWAEGRIRQ